MRNEVVWVNMIRVEILRNRHMASTSFGLQLCRIPEARIEPRV